MGKWNRKFRKVLTAAVISAVVAVGSLAVPIPALAARTVTDDVMIRNDASTDAGIIGSLNEGDEVVILDVLQSGDGYAWYYIQLENGATGYVRSDLIEADDSELAAFQGDAQQQTQQTEEEAEETEEEEPAAAEETAPAAEENAPAEETAAPQTDTAAQSSGAEGYDATKDPHANFRTGYEEEADGSVTWYVYNDDNGSKVKISDLQNQQSAPAAVSGVAKIWRTLAILFGILAAALAVFVLFLIRSIQGGRSKTTRGRALEAIAAADEFEEEEDEEFYFDDDDSEDEYEDEDTEVSESNDAVSAAEDEAGAGDRAAAQDSTITPDSTITMDEPEEVSPTEIPAEELQEAIDAEIENEESVNDEAAAPAAAEDSTEEPAEEADGEAEEADGEAEEAEEVFEEPSVEEPADDYEEADYEEEDYDEEEDYTEEDDFEDSESDGDEDYEEEDYDDDEEEESETRSSKKNSSKGGFFGFLKKVFGSESEEDAEESEDFDDYEEESEEHEFDEFKEYPEDVDLLPREEEYDEDYLEEEGDYEDAESDGEESGRGRLSMQRVMKNVGYKEEEEDFSQDDDYEDSLFEDDDMEYSFISNRKK